MVRVFGQRLQSVFLHKLLFPHDNVEIYFKVTRHIFVCRSTLESSSQELNVEQGVMKSATRAPQGSRLLVRQINGNKSM